MEDEKGRYDFIISRAVTDFKKFVDITRKNITKAENNTLRNGILYLKGGELSEELGRFKDDTTVWNINEFFD